MPTEHGVPLKKCFCLLSLLAGLAPGLPAGLAATASPPLIESTSTNWQDLGIWDDAGIVNDLDSVLVRRGDAFRRLVVTNGFTARPLSQTPAARDSRMVGAAHCGGRLWVFLQRAQEEPCAVDLVDGRVVTFSTSLIRAPWGRGPEIQSHIVIPHAKAAVFMVAGGSGRFWPRPGNRPFYFWLNLATGEQVRFDTDWELDYFDQQQLIAVFKAVGRGSYHAVDMRTGRAVAQVPDRQRAPFVSFNWTDREAAKPVSAFRAFPPDPNPRELMVGLTCGGQVFPLGLDTARDRQLNTRRVRDGYLAFCVTAEDQTGPVPARCYVRKCEEGATPTLVSTTATDCVLLSGGDCLYTAVQRGSQREKGEAWYRAGDGSAEWNLLEGIPRLPPLPDTVAGKDYLHDSMQITLHDAFGSAAGPALALCQFEHQQTDPRAVPVFASSFLPNRYWRRTLVVDRDRRILLSVLGDVDRRDRPDQLWLHNSGHLIAGDFGWSTAGDSRRTVTLRAIAIKEAAHPAP